MTNSKVSDNYLVHSLAKGLKVLASFDYNSKELSIQEISKKTGIHRTTVHRSIYTLEQEGFVERDDKTGKYRLSVKLFELGNIFASGMELRQCARLPLENLANNNLVSAHLAVRDEWEAIYIDKVEPQESMLRYSRIGKKVPLYCTAIGKILLSGIKVEKIIQGYANSSFSFKKRTPNSIGSIDEVIKEIEAVKRLGYAIDNEEFELGIKCIAAPVLDYNSNVVAAISASGTTSQLSEDKARDLIKKVQETARQISVRLGWVDKSP
ncbi:MAG: IclR family transcriptional regulator [Bacillota bacterium]